MSFALYYYDACPFCQRVLRILPKLGVEVELRDILRNGEHRSQLKEATGRTTVPCLRMDNGDDSQWMFESADIIRYLTSL